MNRNSGVHNGFRRIVFDRWVVDSSVVHPTSFGGSSQNHRATIRDPNHSIIPAGARQSDSGRIVKDVTTVHVLRIAGMEKSHSLDPVHVSKIRRVREILDNGVPTNVEHGSIAKERAAGAEGVGLHRKWLDRVGAEVVQSSPGRVTIDHERVMLDLVYNHGMRIRDDGKLHSIYPGRPSLSQRPSRVPSRSGFRSWAGASFRYRRLVRVGDHKGVHIDEIASGTRPAPPAIHDLYVVSPTSEAVLPEESLLPPRYIVPSIHSPSEYSVDVNVRDTVSNSRVSEPLDSGTTEREENRRVLPRGGMKRALDVGR